MPGNLSRKPRNSSMPVWSISAREARERFHTCVEYFCPGGRESVLEQHILNLSRYAGSFPWPAEWLEERKNDYAAGDMEALVHSDYGQYLTERVNRTVEGCLEKLREVKRLCELPDGPYMYGELTEAEIEQLERLTSCKDLEEQDGNRRKETGTEVAYGNEFYPGTAKGNRTA